MGEHAFQKPFDCLDEFKGRKVVIERVDAPPVIGTLEAFDQHINMALTDVEVVWTVYGNEDSENMEYERFFQRGSSVKEVKPLTDQLKEKIGVE